MVNDANTVRLAVAWPMLLSQAETTTRNNNLTIIRLVAAISVTFAHSFALLAGHPYDLIPGLHSGSFGSLAVAVFFALSGLLITQSYVRSKSAWTYFEARWLRIFPALFFANLVTAVIVSQLVKKQGLEAFIDIKNWRYVFGAFFFDYGYYDHAFQNLPLDSVNGSLWTLTIEFRLYLFVLICGLIGLFARKYFALAIFIILTLAAIFHIDFIVLKMFPILFHTKTYDPTILSLPLCFGLGSLVFLFRDKVPLMLTPAIILLMGVIFIDEWLYKVLAFAYASYVFGFHPKVYLPSLNFRFDLSYGIYVLSFPLQQISIYYKVTESPWLLFLVTMSIVFPLSFCSWYVIEKPALKLKNRLNWIKKEGYEKNSFTREQT
jgi:peptidoglycan/LPS O-acetylase OafA/YrhL